MKTDPGLEPIREVRKAISRSLGNDPKRLVAYYMELQESFKDRLQHGPGEPVCEGDATLTSRTAR